MTTLLLRLAGPMQSWGTRSRFAYRFSDAQPSKSAVIGLLAAAQGRRRTDALEDLLTLRFGVRRDQPGSMLRDFHTASGMPLTQRYYLADAVFVVAVEGPEPTIAALAEAVQRPTFPLYLGRRSCPPAHPVYLSLTEHSVAESLGSANPSLRVPWAASEWWRRRQSSRVRLEIVRDADPGEGATEHVNDAPISFNPEHRRYGLRPVVHTECWIHNSSAPERHSVSVPTAHDAMDFPSEA